MVKNYLIKFYTTEGVSLIKNVKAESLSEAKSIIMLEGYMPAVAVPNIFLDILRPVRNAGMKDNELSMFFMELSQLVKSTGSIGKALSYMNKENKKPATGGEDKLVYPIKWLYYNHKRSKLKNRLKLKILMFSCLISVSIMTI